MNWKPNKWQSDDGDFDIEECNATNHSSNKTGGFELYRWLPFPKNEPTSKMREVKYVGKFPTLEEAQQAAETLIKGGESCPPKKSKSTTRPTPQ